MHMIMEHFLFCCWIQKKTFLISLIAIKITVTYRLDMQWCFLFVCLFHYYYFHFTMPNVNYKRNENNCDCSMPCDQDDNTQTFNFRFCKTFSPFICFALSHRDEKKERENAVQLETTNGLPLLLYFLLFNCIVEHITLCTLA